MEIVRIQCQQSEVRSHDRINHKPFPHTKPVSSPHTVDPAGSVCAESLRPSLQERFPVKVATGRASRSDEARVFNESGRHLNVRTERLYRAYAWKAPYVFFFLCFVLCLSFATSASAHRIRARAAVVIDAATGRVLYAKNPDERLMPASTTKLVNALVVLESGTKLDDVTTVSALAASQPPSRAGLKKGDRMTIRALLYAALMKSANDAAVALAEAVGGSEAAFVKMMNRKAMDLGAVDTRFINANGLPGRGQHITARDLAIIMKEALKYPLLREIMGTRVTKVSTKGGKTMYIRNTNRLLWSDDDVLGGKTGYTRSAKNCFVCAGERENDTIIVAILGVPYRGLLWKEAEYLMNAGERVINGRARPIVYLTRNHKSSRRHGSSRKRHRRTWARKRTRKNRAALVKNRIREEKVRAIARQIDDGDRG